MARLVELCRRSHGGGQLAGVDFCATSSSWSVWWGPVQGPTTKGMPFRVGMKLSCKLGRPLRVNP
eukprot:1144987-Pelagomonas_calceolata.AAC.1